MFAFIRGNQPGSVLILVVLVVAVLTLLGTSLLANRVLETRIIHYQQRTVVLQYLAEAGVETIRAELVQNGDLINRHNDPQTEDIRRTLYLPTDYGEAEVISCLRGPNDKGYPEIVATARLPGGYKKSLLVEIKPPLDFALLVGSSLNVNWLEVEEGPPYPGQFEVIGKAVYPTLVTNYSEKIVTPQRRSGFPLPQLDFTVLKKQARSEAQRLPEERRWYFYPDNHGGWITLDNEDFLIHPLVFVEGNVQIVGDINTTGVVVATGIIEIKSENRFLDRVESEVQETFAGATRFINCYWLAQGGIRFTIDSSVYFQGLLYSPAGLDLTLSGDDALEKARFEGILMAREIQVNDAVGLITVVAKPRVMAGLPPGIAFLDYGTTPASYTQIYIP